MYFTIFITILLPKLCLSLLNETFILQFCDTRKITRGTIFHCQNKLSQVQLARKLDKNNLHFLLVDLRYKFDVKTSLKGRHLGAILDANCINYCENLALSQHYFADWYHWLIISELYSNEILDFLKGAPLNINSDVTLLAVDDNGTRYYDVYNPAFRHNGELKLQQLTSLEFPRIGSKYWGRKNMTGVKFISAIVNPSNIPLEVYLTNEENRKEDSMHRLQNVAVRYCKEMFNFSLEIRSTDSWGYLTSNGRFDGLVGLLERRIVDFGSSPLIYKLDRMPVVDYSYGNWILRSTFIYRRPKIVEASSKIFMRPLSTLVWLCVLAMMAGLMLFLKLIFSREKRILKKHNLVDSSWSFLFLFTLGAFCQQGATCHPQLISSRTLSVFVFLFCILIYQFYSASIVSYLLMDPSRRINNLQDLSDSNLRAGIEDILIDRNYFVQTTDPAAIELYNKKIKGNNDSGWYTPEKGLELVKMGGFAFHVETSTAYPIIEDSFTNQEICELEEVQMYRTQPMHTNLQKKSPFREMMNYCMLHLVEDGIMHRLRTFWDARKPLCLENAKTVTISVGLPEFSSGLIVLSYGICASLIMLGCELIHFYKHIFFKKIPFTN